MNNHGTGRYDGGIRHVTLMLTLPRDTSFTSQQEVFLYIPAKSPPFYLKVRIDLSQIKDAITTFPALVETLYLHADRSLYHTPSGLFISCFMEWKMKIR